MPDETMEMSMIMAVSEVRAQQPLTAWDTHALVAEVMKGAAAMSANTTTTGTKMVQWDVESAAGTSIAIVAFSMADTTGSACGNFEHRLFIAMPFLS
jgi:uncharacterized membrane protein YoaK (UPF0700 family)